jgi:hypothetical protein
MLIHEIAYQFSDVLLGVNADALIRRQRIVSAVQLCTLYLDTVLLEIGFLLCVLSRLLSSVFK